MKIKKLYDKNIIHCSNGVEIWDTNKKCRYKGYFINVPSELRKAKVKHIKVSTIGHALTIIVKCDNQGE